MHLTKLAALTAACAALTLPLGPAASQETVDVQVPPRVLTPLAGEELESYILGNIYFLAYHEFGHALVSEFDVPIPGREEDAVDRLATWMMTPDDGEEQPEYLMATIGGWFTAASEKSLDQIAWWSQHGTDEQRAYQVACLLYGNDPKRYKAVADAAEIPAERRPSCAKEAKQNDKSWTQLLKPHYRSDEPADAAPLTSVSLSYGPTQVYAAERDMAVRDQVLEELRRLITQEYMFKPGIMLSMEECGEPNAFWRASDRRLTICYELVREFKRTGEKPILIEEGSVETIPNPENGTS